MLWFNKETESCFGKSFLVTVTNESQFDTTLVMMAMQYIFKNFDGLFRTKFGEWLKNWVRVL